MKTEDIKIWQHRLPSKQPHEPALWREESKARQEETDELRTALKERDVEIAKLGADVRTCVNSWTALKEQTTSCIDELRAALAERDAEIEKLKATFAALDEATMGKLCMQRAVMQQALDAMVVGYRHTKPGYNAAIAALKEALK